MQTQVIKRQQKGHVRGNVPLTVDRVSYNYEILIDLKFILFDAPLIQVKDKTGRK